MFRRIGIIAKDADKEVADALHRVLNLLESRGLETVVGENCSAVVGAHGVPTVAESEIARERDLVLAIGGDGTLLRAAKIAFPEDVPVMGLNLGRLGFLTDLTPDQVPAGFGAILDGRYVTEERCVLGAEMLRDGNVISTATGLNDIVIQKWNTARLIAFDTYVDGRFVNSQRADGMVVSTPTGSTAYSLSSGGPIVHPQLNAIVLVPICPHSLTNRPIVLDDRALVEIRIGREFVEESRVTCDGEPMVEAQPGDSVQITRHERVVRLIHPADHDHFATLRAKLHWGQSPC